MPRTLYLFTNSFPFGDSSEVAFLTNELVHLRRAFNNIILVPQTKSPDSKLICNEYPVDLGLIKDSPNQYWRAIFLLFRMEILREIISAIYKKQFKNIRRLWWSLVTISNTRRWATQKIKSDELILFYTYWFTDLTTGLALTKKNRPNITLISRAHRYDLYEEQTSFNYFPLRPLALRYLDHLFLISQDGRDYIQAKYPQHSEKFSVARLGVIEQDEMTQTSQEPESISIVSCAYIRPVKRIDLLCDAIKFLSIKEPHWKIRWNHFGDGTSKDTEIIKEKIERFGPNIKTILWGNVTNKAIIDFYRTEEVDVFVSVSASEGIPMSMMEAASFGIPIISTDIGGVHELVTNENGLLLPKDVTSEQTAEAIANFIIGNHHHSKRQMIKDTWKKQFSATVNNSDFASKLLRF